MTNVQSVLDHVHRRAVQNPQLRVLTGVVRVLLALAFVPSGLAKVMGVPFTSMPTTTPIGYFFDGFFQVGAYYRFIGIAQLLAAALLVFPRTAALGAAFYFPIILNIFVVTVALEFRGTWAIAGLMLLANTYLLCWDYDRWKALLPGFVESENLDARHVGVVLTTVLLGAAALGAIGVLGIHRAWLVGTSMLQPMLVLMGGALVGIWAFGMCLRKAGLGRGSGLTGTGTDGGASATS